MLPSTQTLADHILMRAKLIHMLDPILEQTYIEVSQQPDKLHIAVCEVHEMGFCRTIGLLLYPKLKELFVAICRGLRDGHLPLMGTQAFYDSTLILAWRYEGKTLLEEKRFHGAFLDHLRRNPDARLLRHLVFGYFRDFSRNKPDFVSALALIIREYLSGGRTSEFKVRYYIL